MQTSLFFNVITILFCIAVRVLSKKGDKLVQKELSQRNSEFKEAWARKEASRMVQEFFTKNRTVMKNENPLMISDASLEDLLVREQANYPIVDCYVQVAGKLSKVKAYSIANCKYFNEDRSKVLNSGRGFTIWKFEDTKWKFDVVLYIS